MDDEKNQLLIENEQLRKDIESLLQTRETIQEKATTLITSTVEKNKAAERKIKELIKSLEELEQRNTMMKEKIEGLKDVEQELVEKRREYMKMYTETTNMKQTVAKVCFSFKGVQKFKINLNQLQLEIIQK